MSVEDNLNIVKIRTVDRLINILQSNDKFAKKNAFVEINKTMKQASAVELKELYDKLANALRICFRDSTEACRENALQSTIDFMKHLDNERNYLVSLVPAVHSRICEEEDYEHSEEIRNLYVKLLELLIDKYDQDIAPYAENIMEILTALLADEAPHVKKSCCSGLIKLAKTVPFEFFNNTKKCVRPLVKNITHQHWRVRVSTIEAIEWAMLKGDNKCVPDVINPLSRRLLDDSPFVRLAIIKLAGHWLLDLRDRYSFFNAILPMILTGLTDECEDVLKESKTLWAKAGEQYVRENENDYKARMDYEPLTLDHYPPGVERPGLGCRILIERECSKFVSAIGLEISDWVTQVKIKSAQLLSQVMLHAEHNITMHVDKIIGPMTKAVLDDEVPQVVNFVRLSAYYMGFFVPPKVYCDLIVEFTKEGNNGDRIIVACLINGSKKVDLKAQMSKIATLLSGNTFKRKDHEALLELVASILKICQEDSVDIGAEIFSALIRVIGLTEAHPVLSKGLELLEEFVKLSGGDKRQTYDKFCNLLINSFKKVVWVVHCHEQFIFYALATHGGEIVSSNLTEILEIIKDALSPTSDAEVKLKIYMAINEIIKSHEITLPTVEDKEIFLKAMLNDILPVDLKWKPGRSPEAIRTIACTTLYVALTTLSVHYQFPSSIIPLLESLIEDAADKTRTFALYSLIVLSINSEIHEDDTFHRIIANVSKRLDDCERKIRELAVKCIHKLYEVHLRSPGEYHVNRGVLDFLYNILLIHLDDSEKNFRELVFVCLETVAKVEPIKLREKLIDQNFRDKEILSRLKNSIEEKLKSRQYLEYQQQEPESNSFQDEETDSTESVSDKEENNDTTQIENEIETKLNIEDELKLNPDGVKDKDEVSNVVTRNEIGQGDS